VRPVLKNDNSGHAAHQFLAGLYHMGDAGREKVSKKGMESFSRQVAPRLFYHEGADEQLNLPNMSGHDQIASEPGC